MSLCFNMKIYLILPLAWSSLQADVDEKCDGGLALKPEVVQSTSHSSQQQPASSVLVLEEKEARWDNGTLNYWAAEYRKTEGQGFTVKVDRCPQVIAGFQIKNVARGSLSSHGTKGFRVSGALDENGPWKTLVEDQLVDTEGKSAVLRNFTFEEPFEVQYLKFDLISYWGTNGGGLQFFAAIPTTIGCSDSTWTDWSPCCNEETRRTRTAWIADQCKPVFEVHSCSGDKCPVDCKVTEWSSWSDCLPVNLESLCHDCRIHVANRSRSVLTFEEHSGKECPNPDGLTETKICLTSETLVIGLATTTVVLLLLLIFVIIGVVVFIYKGKSSANRVIKTDVNPMYGIDYEGEDKNPHSSVAEESYDYMGN